MPPRAIVMEDEMGDGWGLQPKQDHPLAGNPPTPLLAHFPMTQEHFLATF